MTIETAELIARAAHALHVEPFGGRPYIEHLERVVALVSERAKIVAYLHDILEDTPTTVGGLIAFGIAGEHLMAITALTRKETETYAEYIHRVITEGGPLALEVKIADLQDHLRPGVEIPPTLRVRYEKTLAQLEAQVVKETL